MDFAIFAADHNQADIAQAIRQSRVSPEDLFITTKIPCTGDSDSALAHVRADLQQLNRTQVDLVLIHGTGAVPPFAPGDPQYSKNCSSLAQIQGTYAGLERALELKLARAIGVSNFQIPHLSAIAESAKHGPPSVNQMRQYVGYHTMDQTWKYCRMHGITWMAYSPLGPIGHAKPVLVDKTVLQIAHAHNVSAAQVAFAWLAQSNASLTTASDDANYDVEDLDIGSFNLSADEIKVLNQLRIDPEAPPSPPAVHAPAFIKTDDGNILTSTGAASFRSSAGAIVLKNARISFSFNTVLQPGDTPAGNAGHACKMRAAGKL